MKAKSFIQFIFESDDKWIETDTEKIGGGHGSRPGPKRVRLGGDTKKYEILKFIYISGEWGRSYTEILKFIQEDLRGMTYVPSEDRGRYATYLLGVQGSFHGFGARHGLLSQYCDKKEGRWVLTDSALINHFNKLRDEGKLKTLDQISGMSPEELDSFKLLREIGLNIFPWD